MRTRREDPGAKPAALAEEVGLEHPHPAGVGALRVAKYSMRAVIDAAHLCFAATVTSSVRRTTS